MDAPVGKALQRSLQKNLILSTSRNLFREHGYENTTLRMIAENSNMGLGNIYNYFKAKEDIIYEIVKNDMVRSINIQMDGLANVGSVGAVGDVESIIRNGVHLWNAHDGTAMLVDMRLTNLSPARQKELVKLRDRYESILRESIQKGVDTSDFRQVSISVISMCILQMVAHTAVWFSPKGPLSLDEISNIIVDLVLNGIRNHTGVNSRD